MLPQMFQSGTGDPPVNDVPEAPISSICHFPFDIFHLPSRNRAFLISASHFSIANGVFSPFNDKSEMISEIWKMFRSALRQLSSGLLTPLPPLFKTCV
jgi:hypothetical protein